MKTQKAVSETRHLPPDKPGLHVFASKAKKRAYPTKYNILSSGDIPHSIYLILEGSVAALVDEPDGRQLTLAYLGPGEFFGEMCTFPNQQQRTAIVRTRSAAIVAEMGYEAFRELAQTQPEIMFEVAGQLAARLRDTTQRLSDLTFVDTTGRVAGALLRLGSSPDARRENGEIVIKLSRRELASLVGCSHEMAGRILIKMQDDGLITSKGRSITIHNAVEL